MLKKAFLIGLLIIMISIAMAQDTTMNTNNYIIVYNVFGQMIYQTTTPEFTLNLDLNSQPRGLNLLRVQSSGNYFTKKVVVQ